MKTYLHVCLVCLALISLNCVIVTSQDESLSEYLWRKTNRMHEAALASPIIQGLKNATLDPTRFGGYMVQDAVYCYAAKGCLDHAASRVTNSSGLKEFLQATSASYETYYKDLYKAWHISNANGIQPGTACAGYVGHLVTVSSTLEPIYLVVALIPCARLWPWLGSEIHASTGDFGVYTNWVTENLNPGSHGYKQYEDLINTAYIEDRINKKKALEVYTRSMQGEVDFFSTV